MTRYKCQHRGFTCPHGCHNTNYDFSHINRLNVACKKGEFLLYTNLIKEKDY